MTGWKHVDRILDWGRNNPDRVFYIGAAMVAVTWLCRL